MNQKRRVINFVGPKKPEREQVMIQQMNWQDQCFWLSPERMMFWEEQKMLIASDLHIGKTGHFRKYGIAVPQDVYKNDLQRLFAGLQHFQPKQLVIVGDLFHSHANKELDWFVRWRNDFSNTQFILIKGNHDILEDEWYAQNGIDTVLHMVESGILLQHEEDKPTALQNRKGIICGHVHPAITIKTGPRQHVRLPCFYFNSHQCVLPAFGQFTGTHSLRPVKGDEVFAINGKELMRITF